jgi:prepilin-type processing-associated H-X9-DG protein
MLENGLPVSAGDYAANTGTTGYDHTVKMPQGPEIVHNGVFRAETGLRFAEIMDGLSNTLLVGEKHVPLAAMGTALPGPDGKTPLDCGLYDGHNPSCNTRGGGPLFPLASSDNDFGWKFGSRHPGHCQFAFCDGTVRSVRNSIDPFVLGLLCQRNDNQPIPGE